MVDFGMAILAGATTNAILLGALAYLTKSLLGSWLNKDLERHKSDLGKDIEAFKQGLKNTADSELEKLRHELKVEAAGLERRGIILAERRAKVLASLFRYICNFSNKLDHLTSVMKRSPESSRTAQAEMVKAAAELYNYYDPRQIYLPANLCEKIEDMHARLIPARVESFRARGPEDLGEAWSKASDDVEQMRQEVLILFRQLLGASSNLN